MQVHLAKPSDTPSSDGDGSDTPPLLSKGVVQGLHPLARAARQSRSDAVALPVLPVPEQRGLAGSKAARPTRLRAGVRTRRCRPICGWDARGRDPPPPPEDRFATSTWIRLSVCRSGSNARTATAARKAPPSPVFPCRSLQTLRPRPSPRFRRRWPIGSLDQARAEANRRRRLSVPSPVARLADARTKASAPALHWDVSPLRVSSALPWSRAAIRPTRTNGTGETT